MFLCLSRSRLASKCDPHAPSPVLQGNYAEAEPLYKRTQEIFEQSLGRDHPNVPTITDNRAWLLRKCSSAVFFHFHPKIRLYHAVHCIQGNYAEAEPLYERSQAIREKVLGPEHPDVAQSLNNRAELLKSQVRAKRCF